MAQFGVLVTWREVTGTEPTMALVHERLAPFRRDAVIVGIARLAAVLQTWMNEPAFTTDQSLVKRFLPTYYSRIKAIYEAQPHRVTFTRISLLFVLKQAVTICGDEGSDINNATDVEALLSTCLLANDLLLGRLPTRQDTTLEKAVNLLPFTNYVPQNTYPTDLARNLLLINRIAPQLAARADHIDIAASFRAATGIAPQAFCELAFATSTKFITNVNAQLQEPSTALILTDTFFQHTTIPAATVATFFNRLSITTDDLRQQTQGTLGSDFLLFQRHPLIQIGTGRYVCPDPGFLLDKAGPSLYWTLHDATPANRRPALLTYWATIVEHYAHYLFHETYQANGRFLPNPRFPNNDEAADALLLEGSTLIMIEIKASILTTQAKYGFNTATLGDELRHKAITGVDGERKGVAQLRHNITRFLDGESINGISKDDVKTIVPVLVFLDHAFVSPYLNTLYNETFDNRALRRAYRRTIITPLFSITIDDLENALPYTNQHQLCEILESYYRANKGMHGPLSHSRVPLLQGATPGRDIVREQFHEFADTMDQRLFRTTATPDTRTP